MSTAYISLSKTSQTAIPTTSEGGTYNPTLCLEENCSCWRNCTEFSISSHIYKCNLSTLTVMWSNDTRNTSQTHVGQLQSLTTKVPVLGRVPDLWLCSLNICWVNEDNWVYNQFCEKAISTRKRYKRKKRGNLWKKEVTWESIHHRGKQQKSRKEGQRQGSGEVPDGQIQMSIMTKYIL